MADRSASIIVTSYNYARFLRETIDSALSQSYARCEVIVVDDGSSDASPEIIRSYGERIVAIFKANAGQASAFNAGFAASRGDVVFFLDSDDMLLPDAIATAMPCFDAPAVVKVHWPLWIIDERSARTGARLPPSNPPEGDFRPSVLSDGPYYDWNHIPPTSGNAWARSFLESVLPMPEAQYLTCADEYLFALAPVYGLARTIRQPLGCYRAHGNNHGWGRRLSDSKVAADMQRLEFSCRMLREHLARQGVVSDDAAWLARNWNYRWMKSLLVARSELSALIPAGARYVLVDGGDCGDGLLEGRDAVPYTERNGEYCGPPADDAEAVAEMRRLFASGAQFVVFWWTAFWWLDHYAGLGTYIRTTFDEVMSNDRVIVFEARDMRTAAGPESTTEKR